MWWVVEGMAEREERGWHGEWDVEVWRIEERCWIRLGRQVRKLSIAVRIPFSVTREHRDEYIISRTIPFPVLKLQRHVCQVHPIVLPSSTIATQSRV